MLRRCSGALWHLLGTVGAGMARYCVMMPRSRRTGTASFWRVTAGGWSSVMVDYRRRGRQVISEIQNVTCPHFDIDRKRWRVRRCDVGEAEHEGRCAVAGHTVAAVEQLGLDLGGARHGQAERPDSAL